MRFVFIIMLLSATARADNSCRDVELVDGFTMTALPIGVLCTHDGDERMCYKLEGYKRLIIADQELVSLRSSMSEAEKLDQTQERALAEQAVVIQTMKQDREVLEERVARLDQHLNDCQEQQESSGLEEILVGAGAGVLVGLAVGVVSWIVLTLSFSQH